MVRFFTEQIEMKKLQYELQELNTKLAVARAEELKALSVVAQITNPRPTPDAVPHVVTEEDMENNPELKDMGVNVGDEVMIPAGALDSEEPKQRKLKKETAS